MAKLTMWFEKYLIVSWITIGICGLFILYWSFDRTPPFSIQSYNVMNAVRGETSYIVANVTRDTTRDCSVNYVRYLLDKDKVRHELGGNQYMPASAIAKIQKDTPNMMSIGIKIPNDIPIGPMILVTSAEYRCNPVHSWLPIYVTSEINMKALP